MNKIIAVALLSTVFAASALADEVPASADTIKPASDMMAPMHMHGHEMMDEKGDCDTVHEMGNHHGHGMDEHRGQGMGDPYGFGKMGGPGAEMMMHPDTHLLEGLNLSSEQQAKITRISDKLMHDNWATQGLLNDETAKLRDLYEADKRDPAAIDKEYQRVFDLKRKMIETYLEAQNRIEDVLTPDQLQMMKEAHRAMHRMY